MSGVEITVIISVMSTLIIAGATRSAGYGGVLVFKQVKAQWTKIFLKKRLKKSLKNCSYKEFEMVIYDIKNYDTQFEKSLFNSIKTKYNITDDVVESRVKFNERFSLNKNKNTLDDVLDKIEEKYNDMKIIIEEEGF